MMGGECDGVAHHLSVFAFRLHLHWVGIVLCESLLLFPLCCGALISTVACQPRGASSPNHSGSTLNMATRGLTKEKNDRGTAERARSPLCFVSIIFLPWAQGL
jgi:hypothetical protein